MRSYLSACPCGALQLKVTGEPVHNHLCACTRCQRSSGGALGHNAWFRENDVTVTSGTYSIWYPRGDHEPETMKAFCPTCGGGGFSKSGEYLPDTLVIAVGTFADASFAAPDHVHWWADRPHWIGLDAAIERLDGN